MAGAIVKLNDVSYVAIPFREETGGLAKLVHRYSIDPFAAPFRPTGLQRPEDITPYTPLGFPNFSLGLGIDRIPSDSAFVPDFRRRFASTTTADTRFSNGVYLPLLAVAMTDGTSGDPLEVIRCSATFKGQFYALWEDDTSTDIKNRAHDATNTRWELGGTVSASSAAQVALDLMAHKTHLIALTAIENDHVTYTSINGVDWGAAGTTALTTGLLTNNVTAHEDIDAGLLVQIGGEAVAILWEESNGQIAFFSSADIGGTWANENVDISSGNGPQGAVVATGIDNEQKIYVFTREGIWEVDTSASQWTADMIYPMMANPHNGRRATLHTDGSIWFAQGVDNDNAPSVFRMTTTSGQRVVSQVPNDFSMHDGLGNAELGPVNWMTSAPGGVICSQGGGAASRHARIWQHNGHGWHSLRRHPTANKRIEWLGVTVDDSSSGTALYPRLVYSVRDSASDSDTYYLDEPYVNPSSGVSIARESTGFVDLPYMDGGAIDTGTWLRVRINAEDLSSSTGGEYINLDYGITTDLGAPAARNASDLGNILSGTSSILLPSSAGGSDNGAGFAGITMGLRVNLHRDGGDTSQTPVLKDVEVDLLKEPPILQGFIFRFDLAASERLEGKTSEALITALEAARDLNTLPVLRYGNLPVTYVRVRPPLSFLEDVIDPGGETGTAPNTLAQRTGIVEVRLEQVIGT
jgi:hypothetical protein